MNNRFDTSHNMALDLVKKMSKEQDNQILKQLNEFISRGLIEVEITNPTFVMDYDSSELKVSQSVRLVLKDQAYVESLEKQLAESNNIIKELNDSLENFRKILSSRVRGFE